MEYNQKEEISQKETQTENQAQPVQNIDMPKKSRLNKHLERQGLKTLLLSVVGMIIILFLIVKFAIPFITGIGTISDKVSTSVKKDQASSDSSSFLSSPILNPTLDATNSAQVSVSGSSTTGKEVVIFLNGVNIKKLNIENDGTFTTQITLSDGDNIIKTKAIDGNKQSNFSDPLTILFKNSPPNISIDSPSDGSTIKTLQVNITGKTDQDTKVTVNDFWAIVDGNGNYSYSLKLQNGDNQIKAVAVDSAGNRTEKTIHINYSP